MPSTKQRRSRWLVPVAAATVFVGATASFAVAASADTPAPAPAELLTSIAQPSASALSGEVVTRGDLGLPAVPAAIADVGPFSLNDDEVTAAVWVDGDSQQRVTLGSGESEVSAIRNGDQAWLWSAADNRATLMRGDKSEVASQPPGTPGDMAAELLGELEPTSQVTVEDGDPVAGREVYDLVVVPKDDKTLVARIVVAVDVATSVPLQVEVFSRQLDEPAFVSGFSTVDFAAPPASVFEFTPPAGAEIVERQAEAKAEQPSPDVEVVGEGWSAVAVGRIDVTELMAGAATQGSGTPDPAMQQSAAEAFTTFMTLPQVTGDWGSGRVVAGTLFSVLITDDGQYAVGAVAPDELSAALSAGAAE